MTGTTAGVVKTVRWQVAGKSKSAGFAANSGDPGARSECVAESVPVIRAD